MIILIINIEYLPFPLVSFSLPVGMASFSFASTSPLSFTFVSCWPLPGCIFTSFRAEGRGKNEMNMKPEGGQKEPNGREMNGK